MINKFQDFINQYSFIDNEEIYTNGVELVPVLRVLQGWNYCMSLFRNAWAISNGDIHTFGHYCKKILKDMEELE